MSVVRTLLGVRVALHRASTLAASLLVCGAARAEPMLEGSTFTVFERAATTRFPDVAHDGEDGGFLVVSGQQGVTARFVGARGVEGESFEITADPGAFSPRVVGVGGAFLACWLLEPAYSVACRRVERGTPARLGDESIVVAGTVAHLESAPSLACSTTAAECLVTWVEGPDLGVRARRVDLDGAPVGGELDVARTDGVFEALPTVAMSDARGEFLVAYTREPEGGSMAIAARRVSIGADALVGEELELYASTGLNNYPEVAHDPDRDRHLAISWWNEGNPDVAGRLFAGDGSPLGDRIAIAASPGFEGGDGIGLDFDAAADAYLAVFLGPETPGVPQQVWATPVGAEGVPGAAFQVTSGAVTNGVYQPRAASDQQGGFLVVTVVDYGRIDGQLVRLDLPPDGATGTGGGGPGGTGGSGAGGADAGGGDGGAAEGAGGLAVTAATGTTSSRGDDASSSSGGEGGGDGCGCRTSRGPATPWLLAFAPLLARVARRRVRCAGCPDAG